MYSRKIVDTKAKVTQLQEEINSLTADANNPANSAADNAVIKATIANKLAAQIDYNTSLADIEKSRMLKVATLQEKYLQKTFKIKN
jgi:predicted DNA-binding transcriptional regulator YafY